MSELTTDHYRMLLGLDEDWSVDAVTFDPSGKRVVINIYPLRVANAMCADSTAGSNPSSPPPGDFEISKTTA